jgi:hypothetical protein
VQDDWRATKDLTVNIGLAWALASPITEVAGRQANFDFPTGKLLVTGPLSKLNCSMCVPSDGAVGVQFDKTALEPRIGLAWKPMGSQNTAIRAGYAIFHDSSWNQGAQGLWLNPPYFAESDNFIGFAIGPCPYRNTTIDCGLSRSFLPIFTAPPNPASFQGTFWAQNRNFKQGMVQQFNVNVERQLPGSTVLTVGYAGSRSTHILVSDINLNVHSPSACGVVPGYTLGCGLSNSTNPYPNLGTIANFGDVGRAKYDSLQIKAETKERHGLYALLGYTYSRTYDSGMPDNLGTFPGAMYWPLPGGQKLDWALSQINLDHQFTASVLYNLPFGKGKRFGGNWNGAANAILGGWEMDVIEKATSGFPLFVVDSFNNSGVNFQWNGEPVNRPDLVGNPFQPGPVAANPNCPFTPPAQVHTITAWFNPCAFMPATAGELGNAPRAPFSGPRFVNTDLSLIKHIPLREQMNLDFRAEFFNLLNHPQFYLSGGTSAGGMQDIEEASTFAVINQTVNNPRVIQFALKLQF